MKYLDEGFDLTPPRKPLRPHALGYFPRVTLDTTNDSVWIRALLGTIVELFYDDDLLAGLATLKDDCDLSIPLMIWSTDGKTSGTFPAL
jgi:hypothetical protein